MFVNIRFVELCFATLDYGVELLLYGLLFLARLYFAGENYVVYYVRVNSRPVVSGISWISIGSSKD